FVAAFFHQRFKVGVHLLRFGLQTVIAERKLPDPAIGRGIIRGVSNNNGSFVQGGIVGIGTGAHLRLAEVGGLTSGIRMGAGPKDVDGLHGSVCRVDLPAFKP
ncbi:hypothetical protein, partial [Kistimonas scapharcae]|uniref:hypothetical protein n=1 Tax=Kistimonas scapharcae TaxID=1036133 RepID=UPI0031EF8C14